MKNGWKTILAATLLLTGVNLAGAAWQVSVNPEPGEGPMGCLRAGAGSGAVVGTTDLRDGTWHHVGVVLYGGPNPDISTHVLLYVDGRLENTVRKTTLSINTRTAKTPHNLWIGRNIATARPVPNTGKCFRGEIDELYLFTGALDQEEIRKLMSDNVAPPEPEAKAR